ncbi:MAG: hypothetical protein RL685_2030 [Pseudomonadota bacterium]|jgi:uncharacterized protein YegP (UPF0339 family)
MHSRFVLNNSGGQFTFQLRAAGNSEIILTSEPFTRKTSALAGIVAVKACANWDKRFRRRSRRGAAYFVLQAHNGEVLGTSAVFSTASEREAGIEAVRTNARMAKVEDHTQSEPQPESPRPPQRASL